MKNNSRYKARYVTNAVPPERVRPNRQEQGNVRRSFDEAVQEYMYSLRRIKRRRPHRIRSCEQRFFVVLHELMVQTLEGIDRRLGVIRIGGMPHSAERQRPELLVADVHVGGVLHTDAADATEFDGADEAGRFCLRRARERRTCLARVLCQERAA
ncbi:hypothetical protein B0H17DRAFT_1192965 [Mycena rosella]|uniref:Uncharacterized protein n=1 Tax=Mycena rosella TaxID=1033263 RepID=A0AAD7GTY1_MYCRO|nr:hypothetical protein B0H17DRAFT_1192965 [Mycena rosella]